MVKGYLFILAAFIALYGFEYWTSDVSATIFAVLALVHLKEA